MKIRTVAIVGSGALGSYYGCRIAEAGHEVRFLLRGDYSEVSRHGFSIKSVAGDLRIEEPQVFSSPEEIGPVDLVILAWKATANEATERVVTPLLHDETRLLTLQNGLGNVELLEDLFGRGRVLGGLCFVCINRLAAGQIRHTNGGTITLGEPEETGCLDEVAALFGKKVEVQKVANLAFAQWRKLIWNIPFNGLCVTEGGIDTEVLLHERGMEEEVRALMQEVQAVAHQIGHEISDSFLENQIARTKPMGPYKPSSMLDYVNGNPLEVEAIWGEPMRRAQAAQVPVPRLEALYHKIKALDATRSE